MPKQPKRSRRSTSAAIYEPLILSDIAIFLVAFIVGMGVGVVIGVMW